MSADGDIRTAAPAEEAATAKPGSIPRVVWTGLESALERFSDRTLLAAGKVNLISLEAVRMRLGGRWSLRQDHVYDFARRVIERGLGPRGLTLRVSGTDLLVVQPDLSRLAAQAACVRYLREILDHFLGDAHLAADGVLQVTRIAGTNLEARPVDARASQMADREEPLLITEADQARSATSSGAAVRASDGATPRAKPASLAEGRVGDRLSPFMADDGRQHRVTATLEPVFELKGFTRIGFRMIRRVVATRSQEELSPAAISTMSAADLLRVDLATIARGIDRLQRDAGGETQLSLIIPLSYVSLSTQRGRAELVQPLRQAGKLVKLGVICEICDIEGVPPSGLVAEISLIKPFALFVVGRLDHPQPALFQRLKGAGLRALSFDCPTGLSDAEFSAWAAQIIPPAKKTAGSVMVYGVAGERRAGELALLGATHVSIDRGREA